MENIKKRVSVRTYEKREIEKETKQKLIDFLDKIEKENPNFRFPIINSTADGKVGTYGVISGANNYICGIVKDDDYDLVKLGYLFEKIIIYATSLDLGTCWLGGTFNRTQFSEKTNLKEDESFICASPVGHIADKRSIRDKAMRKMAKSDNRKSFDEIFFDGNLNPLQKKDLGDYGQALEMVRIGPSASNKQPWRIVREDSNYHLYLERTPDYAKDLGYDIQLLDMGIAKYHFETTLSQKDESGKWAELDRYPDYENFEYIATWI